MLGVPLSILLNSFTCLNYLQGVQQEICHSRCYLKEEIEIAFLKMKRLWCQNTTHCRRWPYPYTDKKAEERGKYTQQINPTCFKDWWNVRDIVSANVKLSIVET